MHLLQFLKGCVLCRHLPVRCPHYSADNWPPARRGDGRNPLLHIARVGKAARHQGIHSTRSSSTVYGQLGKLKPVIRNPQ